MILCFGSCSKLITYLLHFTFRVVWLGIEFYTAQILFLQRFENLPPLILKFSIAAQNFKNIPILNSLCVIVSFFYGSLNDLLFVPSVLKYHRNMMWFYDHLFYWIVSGPFQLEYYFSSGKFSGIICDFTDDLFIFLFGIPIFQILDLLRWSSHFYFSFVLG